MDNKKFEQLIELIINENEEQARALFHDIVVEKSRQIYEGLMDEEMGMEGMGSHDGVGGLLDEIDVEENGMTEEEDEFSDIPSDDDDSQEIDLDPDAMDDEEGEEGEGNIEDRVVDLEDKLDELMAEFEAMMGHEEGEEDGEDFGGEEDMMEGEQPEWLKKKKDDKKDDKKDSKKDDEDDDEDEEEDEDKLDESVQLQAVKSVTHGDNGVQTKSPTLTKPSINGNGASPANLNKGYQDSGKGGTQGGVLAPTTKDVKGAGSFKNAPGAKFSEKGEAAPKPKFGDDGENHKSVIESKKTTKKIVK